MTDLTDYAKREAERKFPARYLTPESTAQARFADGILHLAEQLQREDVIEAGAAAMVRGRYGHARKIQPWDRDQIQSALAAMLAEIAVIEGRAS